MRTAPDVQHIQALVERDPDWQAILRKTECWGLASLVYTNLQQAIHSGHVPLLVTERLRHLHRLDTIHGVARRELLRMTLLRLAESSIPVIVLKGVALATLVYPSPILRPMGDIDLLVHRGDREQVYEVLRGLRGAAGFSLLDVSDHIFSPRSAERLPAVAGIQIDDFWKRARPAQIEAVAALMFSPEDLLLHLALDLPICPSETDKFVGHVQTLCDIGETCRRYGDAIDWSGLVTRAVAYEVGKQLYHCLHLARELVGAGVPSQALRSC